MEYNDRPRYLRLKLLTIAVPTLFVAIGEVVRSYMLRFRLSPMSLSLIMVAATFIGTVVFSNYVFSVMDDLDSERREYKEAMLALQERERIGREMHDGIAQNLAVMNLNLHHLTDLMKSEKYDQAWDELGQLQGLLNQTYDDVRQSLYDLKVSRRLEEGFWSALEKQVRDFAKYTGVPIDLEPLPRNEVLWNELVSVQILRIIQEALTNVRKHAEARRVRIVCRKTEDQLSFMVVDDGKGFDYDESQASQRHFGLGVMRERAETVGGWATIQSSPGQGTSVTVIVPLGHHHRGGDHGKGKAHVSG